MNSDALDLTFTALADPTRRAVVARLALGEATVNELLAPFQMSQPSMSKHLKVLERAGLISRGRAGQTRPCRLEAGRLKIIAEWVAPYRQIWEDSFDGLDAFLASAEASSTTETPLKPQTKGKKNVRS